MDTIDREHRVVRSSEKRAQPQSGRSSTKITPCGREASFIGTSAVLKWFLHDILFIAMLSLALVGVAFRLPIGYWVILTPIFGVISVIEDGGIS